MRKIRLKIHKVMILLVVFLLLVGCSANKGSGNDSAVGEGEYIQTSDEPGYGNWDYDEEAGQAEAEDTKVPEDNGNDSTGQQDKVIFDSNDKIIRKIFLSLETKEFDNLIKSVETQISELGGYIQTSRLTGRHYDRDNLRYGTIIVRVPKESVDGFVNNIGNISNITQKEENVENVTLQYVDIEARTEALEIEQERLLDLLERAQDIEVIISLEARLTSVRYELQSLKTQIRTIDNQVDFSTITMEIQEVEIMGVGIDTEESIGDRIARGTKETFSNIKEEFADFVVWFVVNLPYILFWIVVVFVIIFVIKRNVNKSNFKRNLKNLDYNNDNDIEINDSSSKDSEE